MCLFFLKSFADRAYLPNGQLVPRTQEGAVIEDIDFAADRILQFLESGKMPTIDGTAIALNAASICVHGDNPHAVTMAQKLRQRLEASGIEIRRFCP